MAKDKTDPNVSALGGNKKALFEVVVFEQQVTKHDVCYEKQKPVTKVGPSFIALKKNEQWIDSFFKNLTCNLIIIK